MSSDKTNRIGRGIIVIVFLLVALFGVAWAYLSYLGSDDVFEPKIVNGDDVPRNKLLQVVGVTYGRNDMPDCSGTLIARGMVLTAAHCACAGIRSNVFVGNDPKKVNGKRDGLYYQVVDWRAAYNCRKQSSATGADIAVLELKNPVNDISPLQLAGGTIGDRATSYRIAGFGASDSAGTNYNYDKLHARVEPWTIGCKTDGLARKYGCQKGREIVAGSDAGHDTCFVDSGSGLLITRSANSGNVARSQYLVAGVTSRGVKGSEQPCGEGGIYAQITPEMRTWIRRAIDAMRRAN